MQGTYSLWTANDSTKETAGHVFVSLEVDAQEFVTLLGLSGCGKTTFARAISGFEELDVGAGMDRGPTDGRRPDPGGGLLLQLEPDKK